MIYLDTHVVLWLYEGLLEKFPATAKKYLENNQLSISPIVQLELQYLFEIKRIHSKGNDIIKYLTETLGILLSDEPLFDVIRAATPLSWTRDPFDRIIVATAKLRNTPLLTKDKHITRHYSHAIW